MEQNQFSSRLTRKEKLGFIGLVVLSVLIIFLGYRQIQNSIKRPSALFALEHSSSSGEEEKTAVQIKEESKQKDTDQDGLSDYDELYIYNTSPYLPDSDSDGTSDKQEIEQGTDPNCPKGQNCGMMEIANPLAAGKVTTTVELPLFVLPTTEQLLAQTIFGGNPDPKVLRDFLLKQGVSKDLLDSIPDAELLSVFQQMVTPTSSSASFLVQNMPALPTATSSAGQLNSLLNFGQTPQNILDPKFLRQLLREKGVTEEDLKKIDDKTLIEAVKQILNK